MLNAINHAAFVDDWVANAAKGLPAERLGPLFEQAVAAIWDRSLVILGEITLTAISERVLLVAREQFPWLVTAQIGTSIISLVDIAADNITLNELQAGLTFVVVEFLSVLGNLTGEVLTPQLHHVLSTIKTASADDAVASQDAAPEKTSRKEP